MTEYIFFLIFYWVHQKLSGEVRDFWPCWPFFVVRRYHTCHVFQFTCSSLRKYIFSRRNLLIENLDKYETGCTHIWSVIRVKFRKQIMLWCLIFHSAELQNYVPALHGIMFGSFNFNKKCNKLCSALLELCWEYFTYN